MTDTERLKKVINESGYKQKYIADKIGLSSYGFQLKRDNISEFTASEIDALCGLLNIGTSEMMEIFFTKKVD